MKNKFFFGFYVMVGFIFILSFAQLITGEIKNTPTVIIIDVAVAFFLCIFWNKFRKIAAAIKNEKSNDEDSPMNLHV